MRKLQIHFFVICVLALGIPNCAFAGMEQAQAAFLKGDYDLAASNCDNSAQGYCLKGRILLQENKITEARAIFENILSDSNAGSFNDAAQLGLADTYFAEEQFQKAIGEYRKIQEKYASSEFNAAALYRLGKSYLKLGQMEQARFYFQKLQQEYPFSFEAKLIDELDNSEFTYSVQVGCFSSFTNADKLVKKLKDKKFDAYISEKEGFPVFYRVRVGKFKNESDAAACKALLEKKGYKTKLCP